MKLLQTAIVNSVAASAALTTNLAGLLPGMDVVADAYAPAGGFSGTAQWQTSVDGTNWTNTGTSWVTTAGGFNRQLIRLAQFVRLNVSAFASGSVQGSILSDID